MYLQRTSNLFRLKAKAESRSGIMSRARMLAMVSPIALSIFCPGISQARALCDIAVSDDAGVIDNISGVRDAVLSLDNAGVTARVIVVGSLGGAPSLDRYVEKIRSSCPSWQDSSGHWKSSMVVLAYAPNDKNAVGLYYGFAESSRLGGGKWQDILRDKLVPGIKAYNHGDKQALSTSLINTITEIQAAIVKPSTGGNTVINQAADYSGLWTFLKFLGFVVVIVLGAVFIIYLRRNKGDKQSAQAEARRLRSECVSSILDITDTATYANLSADVLAITQEDMRAIQARKLARYKSLGMSAASILSNFDSASGDDPTKQDLSEKSYNQFSRRYGEIIQEYIGPAKRLRTEIESGDFSTTSLMPSPLRNDPRGPTNFTSSPSVVTNSSNYTTSPASPTGPVPPIQPQPQTQGGGGSGSRGGGDDGSTGFLTGMVVGELMSDHDYEREREAAREAREEAAREQERQRDRDRDRDRDNNWSSPPPSQYDSGGSYQPQDTSRYDPPDTGGSFNVDPSGPPDNGGSFTNC